MAWFVDATPARLPMDVRVSSRTLRNGKMELVAADPELAEEQEHLDRTFAAYDALPDALSVSRRDRQGDAFTEEVLDSAICPYHHHHGIEERLYVIAGAPVRLR